MTRKTRISGVQIASFSELQGISTHIDHNQYRRPAIRTLGADTSLAEEFSFGFTPIKDS